MPGVNGKQKRCKSFIPGIPTTGRELFIYRSSVHGRRPTVKHSMCGTYEHTVDITVNDSSQSASYHYLSCTTHKRREITVRHNLFLPVIHRYINHVGGVAVKEPHDLHDADGRRPDLQLILRDLHALCDVRITHPLCPTHVSSAATTQLAVAKQDEKIKTNKHKSTAEQHEAKFIAFVTESTGGIGPSSMKLLDEIILASRDHDTLWPHEVVSQELRGAVAIAVQKGNAMTMIAGRNLTIGRAAACPAA